MNFQIADKSIVDQGYNNKEWQSVLDRFKCDIEKYIIEKKSHLIISNIEFSNFEKIKNSFIFSNNKIEFEDDINEGEELEKKVFATMCSLFGDSTFKNAFLKNGNNRKGFTDIFSSHQYGTFVIETKALSAKKSFEKDVFKQEQNVKKQISKAIDQIVGGIKSIKSNHTIYDTRDNKEFIFDRNMIPHCIILSSEILNYSDWRELDRKIFDAITKESLYLNIMDISEFLSLIKMSAGSREKFDYFLMKRSEKFLETRTFFYKANMLFEKL